MTVIYSPTHGERWLWVKELTLVDAFRLAVMQAYARSIDRMMMDTLPMARFRAGRTSKLKKKRKKPC